MWKKVSGVGNSNDLESIRSAVRQARAEFNDAMQHNYAKRQEYLQIKANNDIEREELRLEEKMAKSFKFTKMSKKVPFLPSLHIKGQLQDKVTSIDDQTPYRDNREIAALIQPSKVADKTRRFSLVSTQQTGFLNKPVG